MVQTADSSPLPNGFKIEDKMLFSDLPASAVLATELSLTIEVSLAAVSLIGAEAIDAAFIN